MSAIISDVDGSLHVKEVLTAGSIPQIEEALRAPPIRAMTGDDAVGESDFVVFASGLADVAALALPDADTFPPRGFVIKLDDAGYDVTLTPTGGQTIDGAAELTVAGNWAFRWIVPWDGDWLVISKG